MDKVIVADIDILNPRLLGLRSLSRIFLERVGEVLILDVGGGSTDIYLFARNQSVRVGRGLGIYQNAKSIVAQIGEDNIIDRYGSDWEVLVKPIPKTAKEISFGRELATFALQKTLIDFCSSYSSPAESSMPKLDLSQLRWVIGTGGALNNLPGELEIIKEALMHCQGINFPEDGFPVLLDRDNILASLGALEVRDEDGIWELLLESLGVDS